MAGPALIERIISSLRDHGVRDLLLNLHYKPDSITRVVGDGAALGVRVRYSWERPILGSGGGPRRAFSLLPDERLWVVNGDTLTTVDLAAMADAHARADALVTMALIPNPDPARYGGVLVNDAGAVTAFVPRGTPGPSWHFVGVQIAERAAFASVPDGATTASVGTVYDALMAERTGAVRAFCSDAAFLDIGTPRDYLEACLAVAHGAQNVVSAKACVHPHATLERCVVWDGASVSAGSRLRRVVVGEAVTVPAGFRAEECVLLPSAAADAGSADEIIGDLAIFRMR